MHLLTKEFASVTGETYNTIRNVYGRAGREPRVASGPDFTPGKYRKFFWIDAVAWRIARQLCELGMTWDAAAQLTSESYVASWALNQPNDAAGKFFAVWSRVTVTAPNFEQQEQSPIIWHGTPEEIAEIVAMDTQGDVRGERSFTGVAGVRMVSLERAIVHARLLARHAGFDPEGEGFRQLGNDEGQPEADA